MSKKQQQWKKEIKDSDNFVPDPRQGDIIIPVMGPTGSGKSTFINALFGNNIASVGHNLESHTAQINHYILTGKDADPRIIMLDTPGFDDTSLTDREILRRIAVWLARSYDADMTLAGIIYLHDITQTRMTGMAERNLHMIQKLCGTERAESVIFLTTKWGQVQESVGGSRERYLRDEHWIKMLSHGSHMKRFGDSCHSAKSIVRNVQAWKAGNVGFIQIQDELVHMSKILAETDAGRTLRDSLQGLLAQQKREAKMLRQWGEDEVHNNIIENDNKIKSLMEQIKGLNVPLSRKIKRFFGLAVSTTSSLLRPHQENV